jgi:hypothetical protein
MLHPIKNQEEYDNIVKFLKGEGDQVGLFKDEKKRLKKSLIILFSLVTTFT